MWFILINRSFTICTSKWDKNALDFHFLLLKNPDIKKLVKNWIIPFDHLILTIPSKWYWTLSCSKRTHKPAHSDMKNSIAVLLLFMYASAMCNVMSLFIYFRSYDKWGSLIGINLRWVLYETIHKEMCDQIGDILQKIYLRINVIVNQTK